MLEYLAAGAGEGAANSILGNTFGYHNNVNLQRQQFNNQKKLNKQGYELAQMAQRNSASNLVESAKRAGLSPLAVLGQAFTPAVSSGGEAASAHFDSSPVHLGIVESVLAAKQAEHQDLENQKLRTEVNRMKDEDDSFVIGYRQNLEREKADLQDQLKSGKGDKSGVENRIAEIDASIKKLDDPKYSGTVGILEGYKKSAEQSKASFDVVNNFLQGKLDKDVLVKKLGNGTANILATVPKVERAQLRQNIEHAKQLIAESESKESLNDQTVQKLQVDIEAIGNQLLHANLNDPNFIKYMFGEDSEIYKNWESTDRRERAYKVGEAVLSGIATGGALGVINYSLRSFKKRSENSNGNSLNPEVNHSPHSRSSSNGNPFPYIY